MGCGEAPEHDADHGEADEGGGFSDMTFEVPCQPSVTADPGQGPFDDPAFRQDDEAVKIGALDDFEFPRTGSGDGSGGLCALISAVGEDAFDEGKQSSRSAQQQDRAVAILDVGGMDDHVQQETDCIDENVALATRRLLARVEARRIERGPPFDAPFAVWLSTIAAVGLASRP